MRYWNLFNIVISALKGKQTLRHNYKMKRNVIIHRVVFFSISSFFFHIFLSRTIWKMIHLYVVMFHDDKWLPLYIWKMYYLHRLTLSLSLCTCTAQCISIWNEGGEFKRVAKPFDFFTFSQYLINIMWLDLQISDVTTATEHYTCDRCDRCEKQVTAWMWIDVENYVKSAVSCCLHTISKLEILMCCSIGNINTQTKYMVNRLALALSTRNYINKSKWVLCSWILCMPNVCLKDFPICMCIQYLPKMRIEWTGALDFNWRWFDWFEMA